MMPVPSTSAKPARAAFPVSPEVAVRMMIFSFRLFFFAEVTIRYGSMESAISLKAKVGPWNSSRYVSPSASFIGTISSVSNLLS